ncbi:MAG: carboxyvinyl-carboxyphosphonate phosphorylmutase, partial [Synergistales bacterium]|nr:carboxyvinyl-carboxyphosphonate phosphorylmutase [Synergistales bacterium]
MSRERKSTLLRERLKKAGALVGVGVYDALSARIAELCGFEVVHHS